MANNDMNHMDYIDGIAENDASVLRMKEDTYKGSWKRAGGRSAWFMMRRNMDRLITMLSPKPAPSYVNVANVHDTIKAIDHIVHYEGNGGRNLPGSIEATRGILAHLRDGYTAEDVFAKIEAAPGGEDGTVLAGIRDLRRYLLLIEAEMMARGVVYYEIVPSKFMRDEGGVVTGRSSHAAPVFEEVAIKPNPGSGSQHASLVPWQVDKTYFETFRERLAAKGFDALYFYRQVTPDIFRLEPVVESRKIPKEISASYTMTFSSDTWLLNIAALPDELRDEYPRLQVEMNAFEYDGSKKEFKFMYALRGEKWCLCEEFRDHWARVA